MKKALTVAKWEFLTTVTRGPFIFAVIAMPLFYGGMFALAALASRSAQTSNAQIPTAIVDQAHIVDLTFAAERAADRDRARRAAMKDVNDMVAAAASRSPAAAAAIDAVTPPTAPLVPYDTVDAALDALRTRRVSSVFVIDANYVSSGVITEYSRDSGLFAQQGSRSRQTQLADAIRASLLKTGLAGHALDRAYAPAISLTRNIMNPAGDFRLSKDETGLGAISGSFGVFLLLTMSIFFSAGFLQQATIADRQNRMIEILLSSVDPDQLVLGKLLGLGGAGLVQVGIYLALIILPGSALFSVFQISMAKLALSVTFFVLGFLLFACLMTGTGMLGRTAQESAQFSMIWMLFASAPWFFIANIGAAPNGPLARAMSFFPLTSPITMMMRLSTIDMSPVEIGAVVAVDLLAIYFVFHASARIFRASALMYGKRPTLPELVRWLRAA